MSIKTSSPRMFIPRSTMKRRSSRAWPSAHPWRSVLFVGGRPLNLYINIYIAASLNVQTCFVTFYSAVFVCVLLLSSLLLSLYNPTLHSSPHTHTHTRIMYFHLAMQFLISLPKKTKTKESGSAVAQVVEWSLFPFCEVLRDEVSPGVAIKAANANLDHKGTVLQNQLFEFFFLPATFLFWFQHEL